MLNLRPSDGMMGSRVFVSAGLFLLGLVTVLAQSNSPNQGRGSLIRVIYVNDGTLKIKFNFLDVLCWRV